jgi:MoaA/NifB/PqqE/SkfB family radical SAM enzyme
MTAEVFQAALAYSDGYITIGGGEPTLHPEFWHFLIDAISHENSEYVWMATNGSLTATAIKLANLAKKGVIGCALSLDPWHDEIDYSVVEAFECSTQYGRSEDDQREVRDVSRSGPFNVGRAEETGEGTQDGCACPGLQVRPNGDVYACGCPDAPKLGNVLTGYEESEESTECYKYED